MNRRMCALLVSAATLSAAPELKADEGIWMLQDLNPVLEAQMKSKGLKIGAEGIFNGDGPGICVSDAVVSLNFQGSGSLVSDKGLILSSSRSARNHLPDFPGIWPDCLSSGFWAKSPKDELPLKGEKAFFLKRVFDITDKVNEYAGFQQAAGVPADYGSIKSKIKAYYEEATGLHCVVNSVWGGEKHYLYAYKVYTDLRLVALPPVSVTAFGGYADCLEWPRHSADFALFRIYEDGKPVTEEKSLKVSLKGYRPDSFTMILGYPEASSRHIPPERLHQDESHLFPVNDALRKGRLAIVRKWMDSDPEIRSKYEDRFQDLVRTVKSGEGRSACSYRFAKEDEKLLQEEKLQSWIDAAEYRKDLWGSLVPELKKAYSQTGKGERSKAIFRESVLSASFLCSSLLRAAACDSLEGARAILSDGIRLTDGRVELELFEYAVREFFTSLESCYYGKFQKKVFARFGTDYASLARFLWNRSVVSSEERLGNLAEAGDLRKDPLLLFLTDSPDEVFDNRNGLGEVRKHADCLSEEYGRALYRMGLEEGSPGYPDANSTMRLSFGTVGSYLPHDGVEHRYVSTTRGLLEKMSSGEPDCSLDDRFVSLLRKKNWGAWNAQESRDGLPVAFLGDNDIAGGFDGAPVLNGSGELVGLSAGSNAEGLGGDYSYSSFYNKSVSIDIRYVMWILDKYAGMRKVVKEIRTAD